MNRLVRPLASIALLASAGAARADVMVGDTGTVHHELFGWCVTQTLQVHTVSTLGHDPGESWAIARLISVTIRDHSTDHVAMANDPGGLGVDDWMITINTSIVGVNQLSIAMNAGTIAQSRFDDPDSILSGDVSWAFPFGITGISVPNVVGVVHHYANGFAQAVNFDPGDGLLMSADDPAYTGIVDGTFFTPIPAPGAVGIAIACALARSRRR